MRIMVFVMIAASALTLVPVPSSAQSPRILEQAGNWVAFDAAGFLGYSGTSGDGTRIEITCDVAHSLVPGPGGISVIIAGSEPRAGAEVRLSTAGQSVIATTAQQPGWIDGRGCPGCEENFQSLWSMIRRGDVLEMESEGRRATLRLDGTARVMPAGGCPSD